MNVLIGFGILLALFVGSCWWELRHAEDGCDYCGRTGWGRRCPRHDNVVALRRDTDEVFYRRLWAAIKEVPDAAAPPPASGKGDRSNPPD